MVIDRERHSWCKPPKSVQNTTVARAALQLMIPHLPNPGQKSSSSTQNDRESIDAEISLQKNNDDDARQSQRASDLWHEASKKLHCVHLIHSKGGVDKRPGLRPSQLEMLRHDEEYEYVNCTPPRSPRHNKWTIAHDAMRLVQRRMSNGHHKDDDYNEFQLEAAKLVNTSNVIEKNEAESKMYDGSEHTKLKSPYDGPVNTGNVIKKNEAESKMVDVSVLENSASSSQHAFYSADSTEDKSKKIRKLSSMPSKETCGDEIWCSVEGSASGREDSELEWCDEPLVGQLAKASDQSMLYRKGAPQPRDNGNILKNPITGPSPIAQSSIKNESVSFDAAIVAEPKFYIPFPLPPPPLYDRDDSYDNSSYYSDYDHSRQSTYRKNELPSIPEFTIPKINIDTTHHYYAPEKLSNRSHPSHLLSLYEDHYPKSQCSTLHMSPTIHPNVQVPILPEECSTSQHFISHDLEIEDKEYDYNPTPTWSKEDTTEERLSTKESVASSLASKDDAMGNKIVLHMIDDYRKDKKESIKVPKMKNQIVRRSQDSEDDYGQRISQDKEQNHTDITLYKGAQNPRGISHDPPYQEKLIKNPGPFSPDTKISGCVSSPLDGASFRGSVSSGSPSDKRKTSNRDRELFEFEEQMENDIFVSPNDAKRYSTTTLDQNQHYLNFPDDVSGRRHTAPPNPTGLYFDKPPRTHETVPMLTQKLNPYTLSNERGFNVYDDTPSWDRDSPDDTNGHHVMDDMSTLKRQRLRELIEKFSHRTERSENHAQMIMEPHLSPLSQKESEIKIRPTILNGYEKQHIESSVPSPPHPGGKDMVSESEEDGFFSRLNPIHAQGWLTSFWGKDGTTEEISEDQKNANNPVNDKLVSNPHTINTNDTHFTNVTDLLIKKNKKMEESQHSTWEKVRNHLDVLLPEGYHQQHQHQASDTLFTTVINYFKKEDLQEDKEEKLKYFKSIGEGLEICENIVKKIGRYHCGIIAQYPLIEPSFSFSVRIDKLSKDQKVGFVLGISRIRNLKIPHTLGGNWLFWLICFDGWQWCGKEEHWTPINGLHTGLLQEGVVLQVSIISDTLVLKVGDQIFYGPSHIPNLPLFPSMDLIGIDQITFVPCPYLNKATMHTHDHIDEGSDCTSLTDESTDENEAAEHKLKFSGIGKGIQITKKGLLTRICDSYAGVVCAQPIDAHVGFTLQLVNIPFPERGLAVGFTQNPQIKIGQMLCDEENLWMIGYTGHTWDGTTVSWDSIKWSGDHLKNGDTIGCRIEGHNLVLLENGEIVARMPVHIRLGPMYPAIDLLGVRRAILEIGTNKDWTKKEGYF